MSVRRYFSRTGLLLGLLLLAMTASMAGVRVEVNQGTDPYTGGQVRNLVAPIALYPDPLLAIILPASTYIDQVIEADRKNFGRNERAIDRQDWDISVKALAHYPNLLRKMADDPDWTAALGQAYVEQPSDVMRAIQRLRAQARANGVLRSTREQRVYLDGSYVRIVPAQAAIIYVPQYDANVVYNAHRAKSSRPLLAFGLGLVIGAWLSNDTDWAHQRVYNHGWRGSGWIANSRPHVTVNNTYIVNKDHPAIVNRDISHRQVDRHKVKSYNLPAASDKPKQGDAKSVSQHPAASNDNKHGNEQAGHETKSAGKDEHNDQKNKDKRH
ncbi:MAG TPA: DUF3300 domain-containing protein [Armatimonadota bacterium]|jgi:hypothetical protein